MPSEILRPAAELLVLCASPFKTGRRIARIRQLLSCDKGGPGIDWSEVFSLAVSHRLLPLLYWELKAISADAIPPALAMGFRENLRNSLFLSAELLRVLELFQKDNIQAIPFKGPTLAVRAYNNVALRSFDDLDILIRGEDVWRARDVLVRAGFHTAGRPLNSAREADYVRAYDELVLSGPGGTPLLELHWGFVPPHFAIAFDISDCWPRREEVRLGNRPVCSLNHEDLLLVLAIHGSKHCWSHLGFISDVAWLLTKEGMDWDAVLLRGRRLGIHRMLLVSVWLSGKLLDVQIPAPVARAVARDPEVETLTTEIMRALFGTRHDESSIRANASMHIRMRERLRDRLRYVSRLVFRPGLEDWQGLNLPRGLNFLYTLLRFPRLAFKYGSRVP